MLTRAILFRLRANAQVRSAALGSAKTRSRSLNRHRISFRGPDSRVISTAETILCVLLTKEDASDDLVDDRTARDTALSRCSVDRVNGRATQRSVARAARRRPYLDDRASKA